MNSLAIVFSLSSFLATDIAPLLDDHSVRVHVCVFVPFSIFKLTDFKIL